MDPNILTLSLGSWMALPGIPFTDSSDSQRRASAGSVAHYYQQYVQEMGLSNYFQNSHTVTNIEPRHKTTVDSQLIVTPDNQVRVEVVHAFCKKKKEENDDPKRKCSIITAINYIRSRTKCHNSKSKENCSRSCKRPRDDQKHDLSPNRKVREILDSDFNDFLQEQSVYNINNIVKISDENPNLSKSKTNCDFKNGEKNKLRNYFTDDTKITTKSSSDRLYNMDSKCSCQNNLKERWLVHVKCINTGNTITYSCRNLVLANGASDLPNRLGLSAEKYNLPWVLHDLRTLEKYLDSFSVENGMKNPVLVVGAGLSAADAVIATRFRSIPVLHVYRNKSNSLDKQLPENMYPEYHKVVNFCVFH